MGIQSVRCAIPCCARVEEEQSKCSLITRIAAIGLGGIALLVGILVLSGIPGLSALGTVGGAMLTTIGGLILLAGFCLRCVKGNGIEGSSRQQGTQGSHDPSSSANQQVDLRPIFHQGECWLDHLVDKSSDYVSLKLIITVQAQGKIIATYPYIAHRIPDGDITTVQANFVAREELKLQISDAFQRISLVEKMDPNVIVSFTILTKSQGNQFGLHHRVVDRSGVVSSLSNPQQTIGADKDFVSVFKLHKLKVEPQLDDEYNFI